MVREGHHACGCFEKGNGYYLYDGRVALNIMDSRDLCLSW